MECPIEGNSSSDCKYAMHILIIHVPRCIIFSLVIILLYGNVSILVWFKYTSMLPATLGVCMSMYDVYRNGINKRNQRPRPQNLNAISNSCGTVFLTELHSRWLSTP
ncbi:hypothetical protein L211DRAFT_233535 [Terfezia boudieri ATCC MYA-4762]|uniref:Uncharacterized protein n=1 Tax=Terfezia boudieri ATCC MYA-4762 TaxID=1051890 RepID=A0A3N4LSK3_9PEZI|nr:hypothetical protein L211DRAFT_233535 [Terfezia boudieri ATCC MYA-4762]